MLFMVTILALDLFLANYGFYSYVPWETYIRPHQFVSEIVEKGKMDRYFVDSKDTSSV